MWKQRPNINLVVRAVCPDVGNAWSLIEFSSRLHCILFAIVSRSTDNPTHATIQRIPSLPESKMTLIDLGRNSILISMHIISPLQPIQAAKFPENINVHIEIDFAATNDGQQLNNKCDLNDFERVLGDFAAQLCNFW